MVLYSHINKYFITPVADSIAMNNEIEEIVYALFVSSLSCITFSSSFKKSSLYSNYKNYESNTFIFYMGNIFCSYGVIR